MIEEFLQRYTIEIAVERTDRNPMGPEAWQAKFDHYAVWFNTAHGGMPITISVQGAPPPVETLVKEIGRILHYTAEYDDLQTWCGLMGYPATADFGFYFMQLRRILPAFQNLLTQEGFEDLRQIGAEA